METMETAKFSTYSQVIHKKPMEIMKHVKPMKPMETNKGQKTFKKTT